MSIYDQIIDLAVQGVLDLWKEVEENGACACEVCHADAVIRPLLPYLPYDQDDGKKS